MNVWTYWSGHKPAWIETCLESIRRCCKQSKLHVLGPDYVPDSVRKNLPDRWRYLPPGVGTDCLRATLLAHEGGLWVDADTVMVRDPKTLEGIYRTSDQFLYSVWSAPPERVIAGYCYSPAGHEVAVRWFNAVKSALECAENVGWGDLGERLLTPLVQMSPSSVWRMPLDTFLPVDVDTQWERYFRESGWKDFATQETVAFGLNYSRMTAQKPTTMALDPKGGRMMIHRLLADRGVL